MLKTVFIGIAIVHYLCPSLATSDICPKGDNGTNVRGKECTDVEGNEKGMDSYEKALLMLKTNNAKKGYSVLKELAKHNHRKAILLVAKSHLFADQLPFDLRIALKYLKSIPTNESSNAHLFLGFIYSLGFGVDINSEKSLNNYKLSSNSDNPLAKMAMAFRHQYGIDVDKSCPKALDLYHSVATNVVEDSEQLGGSIVRSIHLWDEKMGSKPNGFVIDLDLIHYYQFLAKRGDPKARVTLGQLYYYGVYGIQKDLGRALTYFKAAADSGDGNALAFVAKYYLFGFHSIRQNYSKAKQLFEMSAQKGNPIGQTGLGLMYKLGKGVKMDFGKAFAYFSQSSRQGWVDGMFQTALMYLHGLGVSRDYSIAFKLLSLASQSQHLSAYYNLGQMYANGLGVGKSCSTALSFYKTVAERGLWSQGLSDAINDYRNNRWFQSFLKYAFLSELGYECAQSNAAFILENHFLDVPDIDHKKRHILALKYWTRSASQGMSFSRIKVGDYHYYGLCGTGIDYELAANYYRSASQFGYSGQALFNLGYLHEKGLGVEKNTRMALVYYDMSSQIDTNAKIPVFLVKMKLKTIAMFERFGKRVDLRQYMGNKWDLVLMAILAIVLCFCIYYKFT